MYTVKVLSFCLLAASRCAVSQDSSVVDIGYAVYQGTRLEEAGVDEYLGMRFAPPPLGNLRFRAPATPAAEERVQDATAVS